MAELDSAVLHRVEDLQCGHDLAGGKGLDLEFAVCRLGHELGNELTGAKERVERLWPAGRQPPFEGRRRLGNRRSGNGCGREARRGRLDELTTFHTSLSLDPMRRVIRMLLRNPASASAPRRNGPP